MPADIAVISANFWHCKRIEYKFNTILKHEQGFTVEEVAQSSPVKCTAPNKVELELKPFKTSIIAVRKAG